MDWSNETYVRLYTRDSISWKRLRWQGQTVLMHLLRKFDRAGIMDGVNDINLDVAIMTGLPDDVVETGMKSLLQEEVLNFDGKILFMPNFLEAQETPKSDKQRQKESREKRRTEACLSQNVTVTTENVTKVKENVTNCHDVTTHVTSGHNVSLLAMPCFALPCSTNNKKLRVDYNTDFDLFWKKYPIRKGKKKAFAVWKQLKNKPKISDLIDALDKQIENKRVSVVNGVFCPEFPYAERWLKNNRWEDEITDTIKQQPKSKTDIYLEKRYEERLKANEQK